MKPALSFVPTEAYFGVFLKLLDDDFLNFVKAFPGFGFKAQGEIWAGVGGANCGPVCVGKFYANAVDGDAVV